MNLRIRIFAVFAAVFAGTGLFAQPVPSIPDYQEGSDALVADRYVIWAQEAMADWRSDQALAAMERAADFSDVSSDVSYLLAYLSDTGGRSSFDILAALEKAISTGLWNRYSEADARLLQARHLIRLRRFPAALDSLDRLRSLTGESTDSQNLRLQALKGLALPGIVPAPSNMPVGPIATVSQVNSQNVDSSQTLPAVAEFCAGVLDAMDRSPDDPRPLRILFEYASRRAQLGNPDTADLDLVEAGLKRLPFLVDKDPDLAWMAVPFINNTEEARRLILAYRSGSIGPNPGFTPNPASIVPALNLGILDDIPAVDELFDNWFPLNKDLIIAVGDMLRSAEGRDYFAEKLHSKFGIIVFDEDRDGIDEGFVYFSKGQLRSFYHNALQSRSVDTAISFDTGLPQDGIFPFSDTGETVQAQIEWDRYPLVRKLTIGNEVFTFAPGSFNYAPIRFLNIGASDTYAGLLLPVPDPLSQNLTRRAVVFAAVTHERPSLEFAGATERVQLRQGFPVLSEVFEKGRIISRTEFENGLPVTQLADLDRDGRMETLRRFRPGSGDLASVERDFDGNGNFEYIELYPEGSSVVTE